MSLFPYLLTDLSWDGNLSLTPKWDAAINHRVRLKRQTPNTTNVNTHANPAFDYGASLQSDSPRSSFPVVSVPLVFFPRGSVRRSGGRFPSLRTFLWIGVFLRGVYVFSRSPRYAGFRHRRSSCFLFFRVAEPGRW